MQTIANKAREYVNYFETITRNNGDVVTVYKDIENTPQALRDAVYNAHNGSLPQDWNYTTFVTLLEKVADYDCKTIDDVDIYRCEIVDGTVDVYTYQLTQWLHDTQALGYLEQAADGFVSDGGVWQLLAHAQYLAIDDIMSHIVDLLASDND